MNANTIEIGNVRIGPGAPLAVIAGPCLAESQALCERVAGPMAERCAALGLGFIFKASFDKANRSSIRSDRGEGLDAGLAMIRRTGEQFGVPTTTDIHHPEQAAAAAAAVHLLQIPAFLSRQTDLLVAAAETGRAVNVKKGQFLSPEEMASVAAKLTAAGGREVLLTERGTFFGYHRLVNDFLGLGDLMALGWPVCFDATHSTQLPGGAGQPGAHRSGGRPERAPLLARAAVAAGVHAVFIETHPAPSSARSDASTMLPLDEALALLPVLARVHAVVSGG